MEGLEILVFIIPAGITLIAIYFYTKYRKAENSRKIIAEDYNDLQNKVNNLQLNALESKLDPHLFKNILNSIQSHAFQTYFALDKLANVLDYILYESRKKFVTPEEEIRFAKSLIEINKIKLSPLFDLRVKSKINESEPLYTQKLLAPLVSVDLIENAFKHADLQNPEAFIDVVFGFEDNHYSLTVSNRVSSKKALKKERSGIGTQTLEQRLELLYDSTYKLDRFVEGDVYIAHLKINLLEHKAKMLAARR